MIVLLAFVAPTVLLAVLLPLWSIAGSLTRVAKFVDALAVGNIEKEEALGD